MASDWSPSHYQIRRFRRVFRIADPAASRLIVHVSADSRFRLFCNGQAVGRGPAKGDCEHQFYDTFDLAPWLRAGENVIAALVMDYSRTQCAPPRLSAPASVMTVDGAFVLDGFLEQAGSPAEHLATGLPGWKYSVDHAYHCLDNGDIPVGFIGYFEHLDASKLPLGWDAPDFDDGAWKPAVPVHWAVHRGDRRDCSVPYTLMPRMIPPLEEERIASFAHGYLPGGVPAGAEWDAWLAGQAAQTVPAHAEVVLLLDAGELTTAYPQLSVRGGAGARVEFTYAEGLRLPWNTPGASFLGQPRDLTNVAVGGWDPNSGWTFDPRGSIQGYRDILDTDGRAFVYEPFHWRTFRFVELRIRTAGQPLTLHALHYRFTAYPFESKAEFHCSDSAFDKFWEISWRTFRLCTHETFEDCPFYEQLQYGGDSQITSQIAMLVAGDARLTRQAIHQLDWSRLSEGLTRCSYPSRIWNVIPSWSLHWIYIVADYVRLSGESGEIRELLPGLHAVLDWFRRHAGADGLPAKLPYWNHADWSPAWDRGQPPGWDSGPTCVIASQYLLALRHTAWLERLLDRAPYAELLEQEAGAVARAIHARFWSENEGLYFDRPGGPELSQYGNAWAVLAGVAGPEQYGRILERLLDDPALAPASFFGRFFMFRALEQMGAYERAFALWDAWHEMVASGLSTWAEESTYWRSHCHAWSAFPPIEFLTCVLGIKPGAPGFAKIVVAPQPCGLDWAEGGMPTPHGFVRVRWDRREDGLEIKVDGPAGIPVEIVQPAEFARETVISFND